MQIPIVEKSSRTLFRIVQVPARLNNSLIVTKVKSKFLANSSSDFALFSSLSHCIDDSPFLCDSQSPIFKTPLDCAIRAFVHRKVDCEVKILSLNQILIVQISSGKFFYFSPKNEKIFLTCDGEVKVEEIFGSGILNLPSGCSAKVSNFRLISTEKSETKIYKKIEAKFEMKATSVGDKMELKENQFFKNLKEFEEILRFEAKPLEFVPELEVSSMKFWRIFLIVCGLITAGLAAKIFKCVFCL